MIHSILITGADQQKRYEKALRIAEGFLGKSTKNHPDFLLVEGLNTIQINQVRDIQKKLQYKPYSGPYKVSLINEAEKLTIPAQHSLLKTLEEPPPASVIILTVQTKESLLSTILSRCQVISLSGEFPPESDKKISEEQFPLTVEIIKKGPGQRLLIGEKFTKNRDQAIEFCQLQLVFWRSLLRRKANLSSNDSRLENLSVTNSEIIKTIRHLQYAMSFLKANVQPRLVVDNLLLSYPK